LLNLYKNADITNLRVLSFNYLLLWGRGSASPSLQRLYRGFTEALQRLYRGFTEGKERSFVCVNRKGFGERAGV